MGPGHASKTLGTAARAGGTEPAGRARAVSGSTAARPVSHATASAAATRKSQLPSRPGSPVGITQPRAAARADGAPSLRGESAHHPRSSSAATSAEASRSGMAPTSFEPFPNHSGGNAAPRSSAAVRPRGRVWFARTAAQASRYLPPWIWCVK
jgi:hypothetical protein